MCGKVATPPKDTEIDVWLESPGGDADAAYKLCLFLRARAAKVRVVVPDYAKSAATLVALCADQILMSSAAELGPLDVQLEHPDREGVIVSGLDVAGSFRHIGQEAVEVVLRGGASASRVTELPRTVLLHNLLTFASSLLHPAVAKLDPHLVLKAAKQLEVTKRYAIELLTKHGWDAKGGMPDRKAKAIARHLVEGYPEHGFVISRWEAKNIGLPVSAGVVTGLMVEVVPPRGSA